MMLHMIVNQVTLPDRPPVSYKRHPSDPDRFQNGKGHVQEAPIALFEAHDVIWAIQTLVDKGWLSKAPRLDTSAGLVPWKSPTVLKMLRARQRYSVDNLQRLPRSPYVVRTDPRIVGRAYADVGMNVPIINVYDRKGAQIAYATKSQPWIFVATPAGRSHRTNAMRTYEKHL